MARKRRTKGPVYPAGAGDSAAADETAKKQRGKPFQPGVSGNPAGRPPGRSGTALFCMSLVDGQAEQIIEKLIKMAVAGKPAALKLAVERLVPLRAARDRHVMFDAMPVVTSAGEIVDAMAALLVKVGSGEISLSEAREYSTVIEIQRRAIETFGLEQRLAALEASVPASTGPVGFAPGAEVPPDVSARIRRLSVPEVK